MSAFCVDIIVELRPYHLVWRESKLIFDRVSTVRHLKDISYFDIYVLCRKSMSNGSWVSTMYLRNKMKTRGVLGTFLKWIKIFFSKMSFKCLTISRSKIRLLWVQRDRNSHIWVNQYIRTAYDLHSVNQVLFFLYLSLKIVSWSNSLYRTLKNHFEFASSKQWFFEHVACGNNRAHSRVERQTDRIATHTHIIRDNTKTSVFIARVSSLCIHLCDICCIPSTVCFLGKLHKNQNY